VVRSHSSPRYCKDDESLRFWRTYAPLLNREGEVSRMIPSQETCLK